MNKDKKKRAARSLSPVTRRVLLLILVIGAVILLKRDQIGFRLYNLLNPIEGEIVFHGEGDRGGVPQIYHLVFNTALKSARVEQLTTLPEGASYPVYSPDGDLVAFQGAESIYVMQADGSAVHRLTRGQRPLWGSHYQVIFQRQIGSYTTDMLTTCTVNAPYVFDLRNGVISPLYEPTAQPPQSSQTSFWDSYRVLESGMLVFNGGHIRGMRCAGNSPGNAFLPDNPSEFHPLFQQFEQMGLLDHATPVFMSQEILFPRDHQLLRTVIYPYQTPPSGIELYVDGQWTLIKSVHSQTVAWSPDGRYFVYDGRHPDGTSVIALSSVDGSFTYPLLGHDGRSYLAPSWRP